MSLTQLSQKLKAFMSDFGLFHHNHGGGGGQLSYFLGGYVCRMTKNCDP